MEKDQDSRDAAAAFGLVGPVLLIAVCIALFFLALLT
jgi:hypothetical protein